jgi:hypothetical protein
MNIIPDEGLIVEKEDSVDPSKQIVSEFLTFYHVLVNGSASSCTCPVHVAMSAMIFYLSLR